VEQYVKRTVQGTQLKFYDFVILGLLSYSMVQKHGSWGEKMKVE